MTLKLDITLNEDEWRRYNDGEKMVVDIKPPPHLQPASVECAILEKPKPMVKPKWKPQPGDFYLSMLQGEVRKVSGPSGHVSEHGLTADDRVDAEERLTALKRLARLHAYVCEHTSTLAKYVGPYNSTVICEGDGTYKACVIEHAPSLTTVMMPLRVARELAAKLNSGEVEL